MIGVKTKGMSRAEFDQLRPQLQQGVGDWLRVRGQRQLSTAVLVIPHEEAFSLEPEA
jgi:hypothetical protein